MTSRPIITIKDRLKNKGNQNPRKTKVTFWRRNLRKEVLKDQDLRSPRCNWNWRMTNQEYEVPKDQRHRTSLPHLVGRLWPREAIQFRNQARKMGVWPRTKQRGATTADRAKWIRISKTMQVVWKGVTLQLQARKSSLQTSCWSLRGSRTKTRINQRADRMLEDRTRNCTSNKAQAWTTWIQRLLQENRD